MKKLLYLVILILTTCTPLRLAEADGTALGLQLIKAAESNNLEIVVNLIFAGADRNMTDVQGMTALMMATKEQNRDIVYTLIAAKVNLDSANRFGYTALIYAAENGNKDILNALIAAGAHPLLRAYGGKTALDYATNDEIKKIVQDAMDQWIKKIKEAVPPQGLPEALKELIILFAGEN